MCQLVSFVGLFKLSFSRPFLFVSVDSAVAAPAFVPRETTQLNMIENIDFTSVAATTNMIATSAGDNGGYFFPVVGLSFLGAIILFLAPPLVDE